MLERVHGSISSSSSIRAPISDSIVLVLGMRYHRQNNRMEGMRLRGKKVPTLQNHGWGTVGCCSEGSLAKSASLPFALKDPKHRPLCLCHHTVDRLQIAATTNPTHSCHQREYLGSYRASTMKSAHSAYSEMILIEIRECQFFLV